MKSLTRVEAGRKAKLDGHTEEDTSAVSLTESTGYVHETDGASNTKRDIICEDLGDYYSKKSVSKDHTQCHCTSWDVWCRYFEITGEIREWFGLFFGTPWKDVSNGTDPHQHRFVGNERLNELGLKWFNDHKMETFDAIVRNGIYEDRKTKVISVGEYVNKMIWYNKLTKEGKIYNIQNIADVVEGGHWILRPTTLWFIDANGNKLFHLQMKGSSKRFSSAYHNLMFHIYKPHVT